MKERTETIRNALKNYHEQHGQSELSQAEISELVRPEFEDAYTNDITYTRHIMEALTTLSEYGDLSARPNNEYRLKFSTNSENSGSSGGDTAMSRSRDSSGQSHTETDDNNSMTQRSDENNSPDSSELEDQSLFELVRSCQMGEAGAIVGGHIDRNALRKELYVETDEDDLVTGFFSDEYEQDGRCLVITGSAGDGKSALLSRAFQQAQSGGSEIKQSHIHMDATASREKHQTYEQTLGNFLDKVSKCIEASGGPRTGLAINLGLAIDFFERQQKKDDFPKIWDAIDGARGQRIYETEKVVALNLGHRSTYEKIPGNIGSGLLRTIVDKFAFDDPESPFHSAYERSTEYCSDPSHCPLHKNVELFTDPEVRETTAKLIAASGMINNVYLNPRAILDLISKMLIPDSLQDITETGSECPVGDAVSHGEKFDSSVLLANAVFERLATHEDRSRGYLDPAARAGLDIDEQILEWSANPQPLDKSLGDTPQWNEYPLEEKIRTKLRMERLTAESGSESTQYWTWLMEFTGALTFFDPPTGIDSDKHKHEAREVVETVSAALQGWTGDGTSEDWVEFVDGVKEEYSFLSRWEDPEPLLDRSRAKTTEETIPGQLWVVLAPGKEDITIPVPVTFDLYVLMKRICRGYSPNARDIERSEGIRLLHSRLSEFTSKQETVRISNSAGEQLLNVERDAFGTIQVKAGSDL